MSDPVTFLTFAESMDSDGTSFQSLGLLAIFPGHSGFQIPGILLTFFRHFSMFHVEHGPTSIQTGAPVDGRAAPVDAIFLAFS